MFTQKEVIRAVYEFKDASEDLILAKSNTFESRVNRLIHIIETNPIINHIVNPYLNMTINYDEIVVDNRGLGSTSIHLPVEIDAQIAYVLQVFQTSTNGEKPIIPYILNIWSSRGDINQMICSFNEQIVRPVLRELTKKLEYLVEDEVQGNNTISPSVLNIIEIGSITANGSNVAIGQNIQQTMDNYDLDKILKDLKDAGISKNLIEKAKPSIETLLLEDNRKNPDKSRVKEALIKILNIGGNVMLKIIVDAMTNPDIISDLLPKVFN